MKFAAIAFGEHLDHLGADVLFREHRGKAQLGLVLRRRGASPSDSTAASAAATGKQRAAIDRVAHGSSHLDPLCGACRALSRALSNCSHWPAIINMEIQFRMRFLNSYGLDHRGRERDWARQSPASRLRSCSYAKLATIFRYSANHQEASRRDPLPAHSETIGENAYRRIRTDIIFGRAAPGEKLQAGAAEGRLWRQRLHARARS